MTIIFSLDEITKVAKQILATPSLKKVITFHAQMGAGKTTLIKELVKELKEEIIMCAKKKHLNCFLMNQYKSGQLNFFLTFQN